MAAATKAGKQPVAGQAGYNPFQSSEDTMQATDVERQVMPVSQRPKKEVSARAAEMARPATAKELIDQLITTGTNPEKLAGVKAWLVDNQEASAEKCFRYLFDSESFGDAPTSPGTLEKAAKWIWPDGWREQVSYTQAPKEEMDDLRRQVSELQADFATRNSELASVRQQLQFAQDRLKEVSGENALLRKGSQIESGIGKNVLAVAGATP